MSDFLKSAFGYISGSSSGRDENDFVGQIVELDNQKLRVRKVIAEGGFAFVFVAQDVTSGKEYALKRLLANDEEKNQLILQEIKFLKKLSGHPNIVQFIAAAAIGKEQSDHGQSEYLLLMELCSGGQLVDFLCKDATLPCDQVLQICYQTCKAVQHMHKQNPPIIHRDLKVENLLISGKGAIKLCDFGSATTTTYNPDNTWSAIKRSLLEDELAKHTTPMYRAPEMLDLYQNYPVNEAGDIWALGCVLYLLCFGVHPFEDSAKLRIINGNYNIPENDTEYRVFHDLIRGMLKVNPLERLTISDIVDRLQQIAAARNVTLKNSLQFGEMPPSQPVLNNSPMREPQVREAQNDYSGYRDVSSANQASSTASAIFSSFKIGASSLMKNVKDASAKVIETVSSTMGKADLDLNYITSRIAVMSFPAEGVESAFKNHIDVVHNYLESRHRGSYAVYNLSQRTYNHLKFEKRVSDCGWDPRKAPSLVTLFAICKNMHLWLKLNRKNICVVHCLDGKAASATVVSAFLVFCHLFESPQQAIHMFSSRRCSTGVLTSQRRYIEYISKIVADSPMIPHSRAVLIKNIILSPVPLFNKMKNGCTPFAEIFVGEERILTTSQEYEKMRGFTIEDGKAIIPVNVSVTGDVTVVVYHARSTFGGKIQGKITSMKMFQLQFYGGFIAPEKTSMKFTQFDLDHLDTPDKYPEMFNVTMDLQVAKIERNDQNYPWDKFDTQKLTPKILFSTREEMHQICSEFGISEAAQNRLSRSSSQSSNESPQHVPKSDTYSESSEKISKNQSGSKNSFFDTLDWHDNSDNLTRKTNEPPKQEKNLPQSESGNFLDTLFWEEGSNNSSSKRDELTIGQETKSRSSFFDTNFEDSSGYTAASDKTPEAKPPGESEIGLLDDTSDAEDDFAALSAQRAQADNITDGKPEELILTDVGNIPTQIRISTPDFFSSVSQSGNSVYNQEADLLNIDGNSSTSVNNLAKNIDLLGFSSEPSNFDLLSSTTLNGTSASKKISSDSFDPFANLDSASTAKTIQLSGASQPSKKSFNSFDPFQNDDNLLGFTENFARSESPNPQANMAKIGASSSPNISRNSSSTSLNAGFQMGNGNIPRNNSGTFQTTNMSQGLGGFGPTRGGSPAFGMSQMGGMGQPAGMTSNKKSDPFADL
ncbi:hypothetical protein CHS0354_042224, partial [Potamilus streckersoni]